METHAIPQLPQPALTPNLSISDVHSCLKFYSEMLNLNLDDMHRNYCNQTSQALPPLLIVQSVMIYRSAAEGLLIFCLIIPVGGNNTVLHRSIC